MFLFFYEFFVSHPRKLIIPCTCFEYSILTFKVLTAEDLFGIEGGLSITGNQMSSIHLCCLNTIHHIALLRTIEERRIIPEEGNDELPELSEGFFHMFLKIFLTCCNSVWLKKVVFIFCIFFSLFGVGVSNLTLFFFIILCLFVLILLFPLPCWKVLQHERWIKKNSSCHEMALPSSPKDFAVYDKWDRPIRLFHSRDVFLIFFLHLPRRPILRGGVGGNGVKTKRRFVRTE